MIKIVPEYITANDMFLDACLGNLLREQRHAEANEWYRFMEWLAAQPPRETHAG